MNASTLMAAGFDPFIDRVVDALTENGIHSKRLISETFGPMP
jgi:ferredoxin-NADP reductase